MKSSGKRCKRGFCRHCADDDTLDSLSLFGFQFTNKLVEAREGPLLEAP